MDVNERSWSVESSPQHAAIRDIALTMVTTSAAVWNIQTVRVDLLAGACR